MPWSMHGVFVVVVVFVLFVFFLNFYIDRVHKFNNKFGTGMRLKDN